MLLAVFGAASYHFGFFRFSYPSVARYPIRGIDVSHHQGRIDWQRVAVDEVTFAYIKASEGGDWRDPLFAANYDGAAAAGLAVGAYHFFTLCRDGLSQAQNFIALVPDSALPPAIDLEYVGNCKTRPSVENFLIELSAFTDAIEAHYGVKPIIYTTRSFYRDYLAASPIGTDSLWVRDLFGTASWPKDREALFQQYASNGRHAGIEGPVDLNIFLGSKEDFLRLIMWQALRRHHTELNGLSPTGSLC